jgi:hypothetical protein
MDWEALYFKIRQKRVSGDTAECINKLYFGTKC